MLEKGKGHENEKGGSGKRPEGEAEEPNLSDAEALATIGSF